MLKHLHINKLLACYAPLLFLLNLMTKSLYLTAEDIGLDEPFSIYHAQFDLATIISQLKNYNNPPLFEILLHFWIKLFDISPISVRIFPLIFASLSPVALFYFGKRFFSLRAGISASLLLSASSLLIYASHDCRVYSLFLLLGILSMHCFLLLLEKRSVSIIVSFVLVNSLLIYAHYFGSFILFFQGIYLLIFYRKLVLKFSGYYFLILLLYIPQLYVMLTRMAQSVSQGTWVEPPSGIESLYYMLWSFSNFPFVTVACIFILFFSLIKAIKRIPAIHPPTVLLLIWFLFAFLGMFFISYKVPMYLSRYLTFALPAYYLLLAICIDYLFRDLPAGKCALAALILCFVFTTDLDPDKKQQVSAGVTLIKRFKDPETLILVEPYDFLPSFAYYYNRNYFSSIHSKVEYYSTDSLLKSEKVYVRYDFSKTGPGEFWTFHKIIYFCNGNNYPAKESGILKMLGERYKLSYSVKLGDNYGLCVIIRKE